MIDSIRDKLKLDFIYFFLKNTLKAMARFLIELALRTAFMYFIFAGIFYATGDFYQTVLLILAMLSARLFMIPGFLSKTIKGHKYYVLTPKEVERIKNKEIPDGVKYIKDFEANLKQGDP